MGRGEGGEKVYSQVMIRDTLGEMGGGRVYSRVMRTCYKVMIQGLSHVLTHSFMLHVKNITFFGQ